MDGICHRYEASWFGWPGSYEIVGRRGLGSKFVRAHFERHEDVSMGEEIAHRAIPL